MTKKIKFSLLSLGLVTAFLHSCKDKHSDEELITTLKITATNQVTGAISTATFADPDGDGGNGPTKFDTLRLSPNATYITSLTLTNESVTPAEDITAEIATEAVDHQFYYTTTVAGMTVKPTDLDKNNLNLGLKTSLITGAANSGRTQIVLKHKPGIKKAGDAVTVGETDIELPSGGFYTEVK